MSRKKFCILGISTGVLVVVVLFVVYQVFPMIMFNQLARSHVLANAPDEKDFNVVLKRDLENYFKAKYQSQISIKYEFLRDGPTQSGVSYPKYYLWVTIFDVDKKIDEGAVRVAAIEQTHFEVTDYLKREEINNNNIYLVFPGPVCEKIKERL